MNQIKTIPLKSIEHCTLNNLSNIHVVTFNVHLAQFDVYINCPNEKDGTIKPVINDIKEWIRSPWTPDV